MRKRKEKKRVARSRAAKREPLARCLSLFLPGKKRTESQLFRLSFSFSSFPNPTPLAQTTLTFSSSVPSCSEMMARTSERT